MDWIADLDSLHSHYGTPSAPALRKLVPRLTPGYRAFIRAARFCILSTVGPEGCDGSPRGDRGPALRESFKRDVKHPRCVMVIRTPEVRSQCARALQRSDLWTSGDCSAGLPSAGQLLHEATAGGIDGPSYHAERATRAHLGWW